MSDMVIGGACPKSNPSVSSTPARIAQKDDCTLRSGLFGQPGGGGDYASVIENRQKKAETTGMIKKKRKFDELNA